MKKVCTENEKLMFTLLFCLIVTSFDAKHFHGHEIFLLEVITITITIDKEAKTIYKQ